MNNNIDISGWKAGHEFKKFDTVFFSGYNHVTPASIPSTTWLTGCISAQSGYYYSESTHTSSHSNSPTGTSSEWTREFQSVPGYNSSVTFEGVNNRIDFGDGYFSLTPQSSNNIKAVYNLNFNSRTDRETKAISNLLESHSFEPLSGAVSGFTGFVFKPFYPYDQKSEHFCDSFSTNHQFNDVNSITTEFINDQNSSTDWLHRFIPSGNTMGIWEAGKSYSQYDTVYHSGGILGNLSGCDGYYFFTGENSTVATVLNGPTGNASLWTNQTFFFKPSAISNTFNEIRFATNDFKNRFVQRFNDGINTNNLKLGLILEGRSNKEAVAISQFLLNKQAYQSFKFTPPAPHNKELNFVCEGWRHTYIFDENHRFELGLEQMPIDLSRKARFFKTMIKNEYGETLAPCDTPFFTPGGARTVTGIDFGDFMTGFSSGTGLFLVNNGDEVIKSTLSLSGVQAASGLYKFVDQNDDRVSNFTHTSFDYLLHPGDSGKFEIMFSTTGHTGQIGQNAGIGASSQDISFHQGRIMYSDEPQVGGVKESALTVSTKDQFLFADPSGDLKIDLTGEAVHDVAPGAPTDFRVEQVPNYPIVTGSWELPDPKTATGVAIYYSTNDAAAGDAGYTLLESGISTGRTTFTHEPVLPSTTYYYKAVAGNMDIVGVGTSVERTFATCAYSANTGSALASVTISTLPIHISVGGPRKILNQVSISGEADKKLSDYGLSNYDNFTGIIFTVEDGTTIMSDDPSVPALRTDNILTHSDGSTRVKLRLTLGRGAQIVGAGGKGADSYDSDNASFALSTELSSAASSDAQPSAYLTEPQSRLGVIHELQGVGPIATRATKGISEGVYLLPGGESAVATNTEPFNGEDGGIAFDIHRSYSEDGVQEVEIDNEYGFIVGGGGGGGQGGARWNNYKNMAKLNKQGEIIFYQPGGAWPGGQVPLREFNLERFNSKFQRSNPSMLKRSSKVKGAGLEVADFAIEVRAGGGGGGGAGFRKNTSTYVGIGTQAVESPSSAKGGKGVGIVTKSRDKEIFRTLDKSYGVMNTRTSRDGQKSKVTDVFNVLGGGKSFNFTQKTVSAGGDGALGRKFTPRGELVVLFNDNTVFQYPDDEMAKVQNETMRNGGGVGGAGGGFGMDGHNGEHPQQFMHSRFKASGTSAGRTEPRNYGYGGSGGLCIETNGCDLRILSSGNIPASGLGVAGGHRSETDAKSSELYRNKYSFGGYLTPRCSGSATAKDADDPRTLGLISGMRGSLDEAIENSDGTKSSTYAAWKAFNQTIDGSDNEYVWFNGGGDGSNAAFPYYLVYDFGVGNEQTVQSYSITSASAGIDQYRTHENCGTILRSVLAPSKWELQATNSNSPFKDSNFVVLHKSNMTQMRWSEEELKEYYEITKSEAFRIGQGQSTTLSDLERKTIWYGNVLGRDVPRQMKPARLRVYSPWETVQEDGPLQGTKVPTEAQGWHVSVPGLTRSFDISNVNAYRYYRLKIIESEYPAAKQCKIADFGLRTRNRGYAGFITVRNKFH